MNLWLRLLWYIMTRAQRGKLEMPRQPSELLFRVWPTDLDLSLHMNNGRYLTIMDLGRIDLIVRSGLWRAMREHGWTPIASTILIRFRREMRLFDKFRLQTQLVAWSESSVVIEHRFVLVGGANDGQVSARALFKGGIYDRATRAFVPVSRLMQEIGIAADSPPLPPEATAFLASDDALRIVERR
jgi:acyl-CoA thioesterase FadM